MRQLILGVVVMVWLVPVANADNGVLEINQACAENTGCFIGDSPNWPVEIDGTVGRSYRLTSDLAIPNQNTDGIVVSANDVSIDLNGFAIMRAGCELSCAATPGTGRGIKPSVGAITGLSVKNGSVIGMGDTGVRVGESGKISDVTVRWCGREGIYAGGFSTVANNEAYSNLLYGIFVETGSTVSSNTVYGNTNDGIHAESSSTVSGNTAQLNDGHGINASAGSTIAGNTVYGNEMNGIVVGDSSTVSGNTVHANTNFGLSFTGSESGYGGNVISLNRSGAVNGSAVQLGPNACDGNTTCP